MSYYFYAIAKETFYTLTGALIIFAILEIIWPGLVLAYININWVLIIWMIVGIVILLNKKPASTGVNQSEQGAACLRRQESR